MHEKAKEQAMGNSLNGRKLGDDAVIAVASIVPAGVAEIARLEIEEKAAYIKP